MSRTPFIHIILLFATLPTLLYSQEMTTMNQHSLSIGVGFSLVKIKDARFSSLTNASYQPVYHVGWSQQSTSTRQEVSVQFSASKRPADGQFFGLKMFMPQMSYSLQKKAGEVWLGGYFNTTTLLSLPVTSTGFFNNNPISYTLTNSIGPKVSYEIATGGEGDDSGIYSSIEASLLSYVVRPAYGHPYPDRFLESGKFSPDRSGMAVPLLTSGKVLTVDKFQSFRLVLGAYLAISDHIKMDLKVRLDYQHVAADKSVEMMAQDILFTTSYTY